MKFKSIFTASFSALVMLLHVATSSANVCGPVTDLAEHLQLVRSGHTYPPYVLHPDLERLRSAYFDLAKESSSLSAGALQAKEVALSAARKRIGIVATLIRAIDASALEKALLWDMHRKELQKYLPAWGSARIDLSSGQILFVGLGDRTYQPHVLLFQNDGSMWRGTIPPDVVRQVRNLTISSIDPDSVGLWEIKADFLGDTPVNSGP